MRGGGHFVNDRKRTTHHIGTSRPVLGGSILKASLGIVSRRIAAHSSLYEVEILRPFFFFFTRNHVREKRLEIPPYLKYLFVRLLLIYLSNYSRGGRKSIS